MEDLWNAHVDMNLFKKMLLTGTALTECSRSILP